jgi:hypothetical protein
MDRTCQHWGELIIGDAYRVTSEDQGIPLLDLVVCSLYYGSQAAWASYRGNRCQEQTSFSSKPGESTSATPHLIQQGSFTGGSSVLLNLGSTEDYHSSECLAVSP